VNEHLYKHLLTGGEVSNAYTKPSCDGFLWFDLWHDMTVMTY